ncbi:UNVERIFIED_CONTAM: hypothetical protein K2H54_022823 [Gekko kuhli]
MNASQAVASLTPNKALQVQAGAVAHHVPGHATHTLLWGINCATHTHTHPAREGPGADGPSEHADRTQNRKEENGRNGVPSALKPKPLRALRVEGDRKNCGVWKAPCMDSCDEIRAMLRLGDGCSTLCIPRKPKWVLTPFRQCLEGGWVGGNAFTLTKWLWEQGGWNQ